MKHWPVRAARARFSELLRAAEPQIVTYRGKPKVEVRAVESKGKKKPKTFLELMRSAPPGFADVELPPRAREPKRTFAEWWKSAPRVPEFRLPRRK